MEAHLSIFYSLIVIGIQVVSVGPLTGGVLIGVLMLEALLMSMSEVQTRGVE